MITDVEIRSTIKAARTSGKTVVELRDGGQRGEGRLALVIRVAPARITSEWYAVWYRHERRKMSKIGSYPAVPLVDARRRFRAEYAPLIAAGESPIGPKARRDRRGVTVKDMFQAYVDNLKADGAASSAKVEMILLGDNGAAAAIGDRMRAADVRPADITPHLSDIYDRGSVAMAKITRAYIGAAFSYAMKAENDYRRSASQATWGISSNPVLAIPNDHDAVKPGQRFLTPAEFRAFWLWLEGRNESSRLSAAVRIIMATGQRLSEILRVSEVMYDRAEKMLDWSKTKNGQPHAIPLPARAVDILDGLTASKAGLFFPKQDDAAAPAGTTGIEKLIKLYCRKTGAKAFTARDLRRTWKTLSGAAGVAKEARDRLQNHARTDVASRHYDRYDYLTEKRAAMKVWSAYMDRIIDGALDTPVVQLTTA